jgi:hypothetical protein
VTSSSPTSTEIASRHRPTWIQILRELGHGERESMFLRGTPPRREDLIGWHFAGANTLVLSRLVGIRKFIKGFYDGPLRSPGGPTPYCHGYNITPRQNADAAEHVYAAPGGVPKRHGFFRVYPVIPGARDDRYPNALLIDYTLGGNGLARPPLVDYLVQPYEDDPDLLLGKAYVALSGIRFFLSFFVLKRLEQHAFRG